MKKVLVIGSANMDTTLYVKSFPKENEEVLIKSKFVQPGGKGANQAVAASRSGLVEVTFVGCIGNDEDGKTLNNILNESGVITKLKVVNESTGSALIYVDESSQNDIKVLPGANKYLLASDISEDYFKGIDVLLLQNEIPSETIEKALKIAAKHNIKVVYNAAPFKAISPSIYRFIDVFNVNEDELKQYSGEEDFVKGVQKLFELGIKKILVTLGEKGSLLYDGKKFYKVDALEVDAIDTVGAGDTYAGYFSACIANGMPEFEAMKIATKASSITVSRKGSIVSIPFGKEFLK